MLNAVPFDSNRVALCPIRGVDGSDYINASYVDGYQDRKAFIACQAPMVSTVEDFWRMVWEQKSDVIVMLCDLIEGGKVSEPLIAIRFPMTTFRSFHYFQLEFGCS